MAQGALWVCGPAGSGKTTAVAQWLRTSRRSVAWMRLDAADSDPGALLPRMRDALLTRSIDAEAAMIYGPEHREQLGKFGRYFFRTLFARMRRTLVWVLDNAHEVDADVLDTLLSIAMEEAPETLSIVVISRSEPGATFARHIAHQHLTVLGRDALKFSVDEATALFSKRALKASTETVTRCCHELDGWAVGLVLAGEALRHDPAQGRAVIASSLDVPTLMNYFAAGVFDHLDETQQTLLLSTAHLPSFTAQHATALSAIVDSAQVLDTLYRHNGFVEIDARAEPQYRVHPVFRNFLQRTLTQRRSVDAVNTLAMRSADLLQASGQLTVAAGLYAMIGAHDALATLIEDNALPLLRSGKDHTVVELVRSLPSASRQDRPYVLFWHAEALTLSAPKQAREAAAQALRVFAAHDDSIGAILAAGTLLSLHRAMRLDVNDPIEVARQCETQFLASWQSIPPQVAAYAATAYLSAVSTLNRGDEIPPAIVQWLLESLHCDGPANSRLRVATILHEQFYIRNETAQARAVEAVANIICDRPEARAAARRTWLVGLGIGFVYQRRLVEAQAALEQAAQLANELGDIESQCQVNAWRIIVRCRLHRAQDALPLVLSADPAFVQVPPLIRANLLWAEGNLFIALRQYDNALTCFDAAIDLYHETNTNVEQGPMLWLGQSMCRLMLARYDAALASLQPLTASQIGGTSRRRLDAFAQAIRAAVALRRGDADARKTLETALVQLRETDYRDFMHGAESVVAELCAQALRLGIEREFVNTVIRHRELEAPADAPSAWPFPVRIRCLGEMQIETRSSDGNERTMRKSVELLQQVLAAAPNAALIDPLIAKLWPGDGREGAQKAFDAALHRLRKRLGNEAALRLSERRLSLNPGIVYVDLLALNAILGASGVDHAEHVTHAVQVVALYRDHFLPALSDDAVSKQRTRIWMQVRKTLVRGIEAARTNGQGDLVAQLAVRLEALDDTLS